ncbi:hypothetical protein Dvina_41245 [Dactylosporangium vinaceum]|uniref:Uncharacterized protein n=1 Tax=Dactylosporangium vinaceum TaxID=53362 RepID=A0ABV5MP75_9ACTN|nr:hypothetical protein [Dactylosporangium vinaceum]UAB94506.1 hypothetical protein Dvina_41245 [Dactylosporangium vinaceum]
MSYGDSLLRELAASGRLADYYETAAPAARQQLHRAAFPIVGPIVFQRITRRIELKRGHVGCASSIERMEPECRDRHHDDVEAVLFDMFRKARVPVTNLEGWMVGRLNAATVDAHRRRRGERGALQKVRVPQWVLKGLDGDAWLMILAYELLTWVGVSATAGTDLWPIDAWVERRARETGDHQSDERTVRQDIETVLAVMRKRPRWYGEYVERPLGRKQAPVRAVPAALRDAPGRPERPLPLVERHDIDESCLLNLAALAVDALRRRLRRGEDPHAAVAEVMHLVFGELTGADELDLVPGTGSLTTQAADLIADAATVERVVAMALEYLGRTD